METKEKDKLKVFLVQALRWFCQYWNTLLTIMVVICMAAGLFWYVHRAIGEQELASRRQLLAAAEGWLGYREDDGSHEEIIDFYNTLDPRPRDYQVTYEDNWCATFGSATAMKAGMTDIIPMECSCEQQINLFKALGHWRENECYLPRTGDYIYYVWDEWRRGDCTAWADHVGIVAETFGPVIKVIEGNKDDMVTYRYIFLNDLCIRGYGLPDYNALPGA